MLRAGFFAEQACEALRALDAVLVGVTQTQSEPSGRVRISVGASFGRGYLLPALPALLARHPRLDVEVALDKRHIDLVAEGYDIGIRGGRVRDSSLVAPRVAQLPLVLAAAPDYLHRRGVPRSMLELDA